MARCFRLTTIQRMNCFKLMVRELVAFWFTAMFLWLSARRRHLIRELTGVGSSMARLLVAGSVRTCCSVARFSHWASLSFATLAQFLAITNSSGSMNASTISGELLTKSNLSGAMNTPAIVPESLLKEC